MQSPHCLYVYVSGLFDHSSPRKDGRSSSECNSCKRFKLYATILGTCVHSFMTAVVLSIVIFVCGQQEDETSKTQNGSKDAGVSGKQLVLGLLVAVSVLAVLETGHTMKVGVLVLAAGLAIFVSKQLALALVMLLEAARRALALVLAALVVVVPAALLALPSALVALVALEVAVVEEVVVIDSSRREYLDHYMICTEPLLNRVFDTFRSCF